MKQIGEISNYYGHLIVFEEKSKYYWTIEDYGHSYEEEIPKYLYDALVKYENERKK